MTNEHHEMPEKFAARIDSMRPRPGPDAPAAIGDECECLSCLSDMKGIYPCLLVDDDV